MQAQVRVGVVGTSWWADLMHLPSLKSHPRAKLTAICGRNRDRAEEIAKKYEIPRVFTDYREMIEQGSLDALVVSTPDDLHYPITLAALDTGLHVLCEKSLALNADHAKAMYEKAEAVGVKHMVCFTYRWLPPYQYLRTLIEDGYLGRCFQAQFRYLGGYGRAAKYGWRFDRQRGNGILGDFGSHIIDLARWYVGDIVKVTAQLGVFVERPGPEGNVLDPANDAALLLLEFADGAQGMLQVSAVAQVGDRLQEQHTVLHGAAGTLEADITYLGEQAGVEVRGARHDDESFSKLAVPDELWGDVDRSSPFIAQVFELFVKQPAGARAFIDAILADQPASPSFYDGWQAQAVIDAAIESHQNGCSVSVPSA